VASFKRNFIASFLLVSLKLLTNCETLFGTLSEFFSSYMFLLEFFKNNENISQKLPAKDLLTYRYQIIFLLPFKIGLNEITAFICSPASVTNSFQDNPDSVAIK
jgi:hypothetical protein